MAYNGATVCNSCTTCNNGWQLMYRKYRRFNIVDFHSDLKEIPMEHIKLVSKDVNEVWLRWKAFFLDILDKHAPVTKIKVKGNSLPCVTSELKALIKTRDYLRPKANKRGSEYLRQAFNHTRNKVNRLLSDLQKATIQKRLKRMKIT